MALGCDLYLLSTLSNEYPSKKTIKLNTPTYILVTSTEKLFYSNGDEPFAEIKITHAQFSDLKVELKIEDWKLYTDESTDYKQPLWLTPKQLGVIKKNCCHEAKIVLCPRCKGTSENGECYKCHGVAEKTLKNKMGAIGFRHANIFTEQDAQTIIDKCKLHKYFSSAAELVCLLNQIVTVSGIYTKQYLDTYPKAENTKILFQTLKQHTDGLLETLGDLKNYSYHDKWVTSENLWEGINLIEPLQNILIEFKLIINNKFYALSLPPQEETENLKKDAEIIRPLITEKTANVDFLKYQIKQFELVLERNRNYLNKIYLVAIKDFSEINNCALPIDGFFIFQVGIKAKGYKFYCGFNPKDLSLLPQSTAQYIKQIKLVFPDKGKFKTLPGKLAEEVKQKLITPKEFIKEKHNYDRQLQDAQNVLDKYKKAEATPIANIKVDNKKNFLNVGKKPAYPVRSMIVNLALIYERKTGKKARPAFYNKIKGLFSEDKFLTFCYEVLKILKAKFQPNEIKQRFGIIFETKKEATKYISIETREKIALNKTIEKALKKKNKTIC